MKNEELSSVISSAMASAISEALSPIQSQLDALKAEKNQDAKPNPDDGDSTKKFTNDDIQDLIKAAVSEVVKPLQDELASYKGQKITETRLQMLEGKFAGVPDSYKNQRLADAKLFINNLDEAGFNEYLTKTESDIAVFNKELADNRISPSVQQWVKNKEEDHFGGKDLHGKTPFNPNPQKQDQGPTTLNGVLTGKTI